MRNWFKKIKPTEWGGGFTFRTVGVGILFTAEKGEAKGIMLNLLFVHLFIEW